MPTGSIVIGATWTGSIVTGGAWSRSGVGGAESRVVGDARVSPAAGVPVAGATRAPSSGLAAGADAEALERHGEKA